MSSKALFFSDTLCCVKRIMVHSGNQHLSWIDPSRNSISQRVGIIPLLVLGRAWLGTANVIGMADTEQARPAPLLVPQRTEEVG